MTNEPIPMTQTEFETLMESVDAFHEAIYKSNYSLAELGRHLLRRSIGLAFWVAGLIIFDMVLFTVLVVKGVL